MKARLRFVPWARLVTAVLLITAFAIALRVGHTIEAVIVGIVTIPTLALIVLWLVGRRRGWLEDGEADDAE